jgi:hypothetical protein
MYVHPQIVRHWLMVGIAALSSICMGTLAVIAIVAARRPSPKQLEERRRRRLAAMGKIIDGVLVDAEPADSTPQVIIYSYRIAGVRYECSQDVSTLAPLLANLRRDYPVQVRYSRHNPADSIVVAETWNGLWTTVESSSRQLRAVETS